MFIERALASDRFGGEGVAENRNGKFTAEHFEAADVVAMFMREKNAIQLRWCDATLFQAQSQLSRAQSAVDENLAVIGGEQRAISGTATAEHGQTEHAA